MDHPKSHPDLNSIYTTRSSKNMSKGFRNEIKIKYIPFKIKNPLLDQNIQEMLPADLRSQMHDLQYISRRSIRKINVERQTHPLNFCKNLQIMQELARRQEQKYIDLINFKLNSAFSRKNRNSKNSAYTEIQDDEDKFSIELNGYDYSQRIQNDFNSFTPNDLDCMQYDRIQFYSVQDLQPNM